MVTVAKDALRNYWHPVAFSDSITTTPQRIVLLDERLVLYRTENGTVSALKDLCIHRGTPLSLGSVEGETIVCAYHGWSYDAEGRCLRIPSVPPDRPIPPKARVESYGAREQFGIVWVCLGDPVADILEFPEYGEKGFHTFLVEDDVWNASAARLVENFIDSAHFAWVHDGLLGHKDKPMVPPIEVSSGEHRLLIDFEVESGTAIHPGATSAIHYEVGLPFTLRQQRTDPDGRQHIVFVAISPVTQNRLHRFSYKMRNYDLDGPDNAYIEKARLVAAQDRVIVEEQRPEELPVDLTAELHIKGPDDPALVYRRTLAALGVEVH